jgi:uncharacterized protein YggE
MNDTERTLHISPPKHIEYAAATALFVLAAFLVVEALGTINDMNNPTAPPVDTITVSGTGNAYAVPDIAKIDFTVMHTSTTVADAQSATTKQANSAIDYMKGQGIADKDVQTLSYDVSPQYSYQNPCLPGSACPDYVVNGSPKITGYQVSETIEVTVRNLDQISTLLQGLGTQNVQNISGPNFTLEDPNAPQNEARTAAIADAKQQATELANELGVRLVRIVNFSEGGNYPVYAKAYAVNAAGGMASTPAPEVPTGQNEYTSNVSITYEIH